MHELNPWKAADRFGTDRTVFEMKKFSLLALSKAELLCRTGFRTFLEKRNSQKIEITLNRIFSCAFHEEKRKLPFTDRPDGL